MSVYHNSLFPKGIVFKSYNIFWFQGWELLSIFVIVVLLLSLSGINFSFISLLHLCSSNEGNMGRVDCSFLPMSNSAGNLFIQKWENYRTQTKPAAHHSLLLQRCLTVCTFCSAIPLDWRNPGLDVTRLKFHSLENCRNYSLLKLFVITVCWDAMSGKNGFHFRIVLPADYCIRGQFREFWTTRR